MLADPDCTVMIMPILLPCDSIQHVNFPSVILSHVLGTHL